jgi:hypothetical protein
LSRVVSGISFDSAQKASPDKFSAYRAVAEDSRLDIYAVQLWAALALIFHNAETGQCNPSHAALARFARQSERQIRYSLQQLIGAGWLLAARRRGRANAYSLRWTPAQCAAHPGTMCRHNRAKGTEPKIASIREEGILESEVAALGEPSP